MALQVVTKRQIGICFTVWLVWYHNCCMSLITWFFLHFLKKFADFSNFSHKACKKVFWKYLKFDFVWLYNSYMSFFLKSWDFIGAISNTKQCLTTIHNPCKLIPSKHAAKWCPYVNPLCDTKGDHSGRNRTRACYASKRVPRYDKMKEKKGMSKNMSYANIYV